MALGLIRVRGKRGDIALDHTVLTESGNNLIPVITGDQGHAPEIVKGEKDLLEMTVVPDHEIVEGLDPVHESVEGPDPDHEAEEIPDTVISITNIHRMYGVGNGNRLIELGLLHCVCCSGCLIVTRASYREGVKYFPCVICFSS